MKEEEKAKINNATNQSKNTSQSDNKKLNGTSKKVDVKLNDSTKKDNTKNENIQRDKKDANAKPQNPRFKNKRPSEFEERVIAIRRVIKVVKGGRRFRFSALVVIGNKKGKVAFGLGKSHEVPDAIKKAIKNAKKNILNVNLIKDADTISHEWTAKHNASKVMIKPAKEGTGIIGSYSVRSVLELAGIRNVYTKSLGSNTPQNVIQATIKALSELRTKEEINELRDRNKGTQKE